MCEYLLSVGVMLPLMAVLSAAWIEVDPESCTNTHNVIFTVKTKLSFTKLCFIIQETSEGKIL